MKIVELIAAAAVAEGVELAFNLPDEVTIFISQALQEQGVRIIRARHEQNAVSMADGHTRATGKPALCVVGPGPALAQTGNGLMTAWRHRSPVLMLLGGIPDASRGGIKEFNSRRFAESVEAKYLEIRRSSTLADDLYEAFRLVRLCEGPVILRTPDVEGLLADYHGQWRYKAAPATMRRPLAVDLESDPIDEAAGMLVFARRPVILAGRGAVLADAYDGIVRLADRIGALLVTSVQARGYFRGHPRDIGIIGGFATDAAIELLADADRILAVGVSLNIYQTGGGAIAPKAAVIQIDQNADAIGEFSRVDLAIVGDARAAVDAINRALELADVPHTSLWTHADVQPRIESARQLPAPAGPSSSDRLPVTRALAELEEILPRDRLVILDAGLFLWFTVDAISLPRPDACIWSMDFGSIGLGLAMGIGTALARPDTRCVTFVGDGGLLMNIGELETAVRERVPLTLIVLNDGEYGPEVRFLAAKGKPQDLAVFEDVDFAGVARAFGARGITVRNLDDFAVARTEMLQNDSPLLIDVKVTQFEEHRSFR